MKTVKLFPQKWLLIISLAVLGSVNSALAEDKPTKPLNSTELLGMKLIDANINIVRAHLWNIGGFLQAKSTVRQRNVDKFFPWSTIRDSYHLTFHYNHAGNLVSATRLYRPYSTEFENKRTQIGTRDVARQLIEELGQPTQVKTKGWGGTPSYPSYTWQDDSMKVEVDREGSEYFGNVFVKYTVKKNKRYEVLEDELAKKMGI